MNDYKLIPKLLTKTIFSEPQSNFINKSLSFLNRLC